MALIRISPLLIRNKIAILLICESVAYIDGNIVITVY
jgi:hypothetical protein